jgi:tripartite-type tricarboxylate transporter receptor subunit TctC
MSAQEAGIPGVDASIWVGLFAPKGTPKEVLGKLYKAAAEALTQPDVKQRYATVGGAETTTMGSTEFTKRIRSDLERYRKVAAQIGIQQQ